jgi:hypothetical protein
MSNATSTTCEGGDPSIAADAALRSQVIRSRVVKPRRDFRASLIHTYAPVDRAKHAISLCLSPSPWAIGS